ncbi:cobalamin biosynthesis bifunctional protein CbiET, partial [Aromatoleum toluclasticum]|nr:cobalamin biosynthesis bifunctional protein CbiET [Aromatoleum toluclasticum]
AGYGEGVRLSVAARLCLPDETICADLPLAEAAARRFPVPNSSVIDRVATPSQRAVFGYEDGDFVQRPPEKGLLTTLEARAVSLAKHGLRADSRVWDIGA